jgi:hypothetical protein
MELIMNTNINRIKREQVTCRCAAYKFPHRLDSKACKELYNSELEAGYEPDSLQSLGLVGLFAPDNSQPVRF